MVTSVHILFSRSAVIRCWEVMREKTRAGSAVVMDPIAILSMDYSMLMIFKSVS